MSHIIAALSLSPLPLRTTTSRNTFKITTRYYYHNFLYEIYIISIQSIFAKNRTSTK